MNQKLFLAAITLLSIILSISLYNTFSYNRSLSTKSKVIPSHIHALYSKWKATYGKIYDSPKEAAFRLEEFYKTYKLLNRMKAKFPEAVFKLNHLSDTTGEEFLAKYANKIPKDKNTLKTPNNLSSGKPIEGLRIDDYSLDLLDENHPLPGFVNNSGYIAKPKRS